MKITEEDKEWLDRGHQFGVFYAIGNAFNVQPKVMKTGHDKLEAYKQRLAIVNEHKARGYSVTQKCDIVVVMHRVWFTAKGVRKEDFVWIYVGLVEPNEEKKADQMSMFSMDDEQ